ncbi:hypothetical protein, partial [Streptomyces sp. wa1002]|uniref:hypothetical protein n=1 Tax=Streptomyces sp. wa1002 TaxID=1828186 RepID=UPI001C54EA72
MRPARLKQGRARIRPGAQNSIAAANTASATVHSVAVSAPRGASGSGRAASIRTIRRLSLIHIS